MQDKLKVCAEALGWDILNIIIAGEHITIQGKNGVWGYDSFTQFATELVTTLGIATWQDHEGVWFAAKDVVDRSLTAKSVILYYPTFYFHKDYSQAVIDCVAGDKS